MRIELLCSCQPYPLAGAPKQIQSFEAYPKTSAIWMNKDVESERIPDLQT